MVAGRKSEPTVGVTRLVLTVVGVLLAIGTPFAIAFLNAGSRLHLQFPIIAGVELSSVAAGLVLLYLGFRGQVPSASKH